MQKFEKKIINICIYRSSSIGDMVLASSCLQLLIPFGEAVNVTWLGGEPALGFMQRAFPKVRFLDIKSTPNNYTNLKAFSIALANIDLFINLQNNLKSRIVALLCKLSCKCHVVSMNKKQGLRIWLILRALFLGRRVKYRNLGARQQFYQFKLMAQCLFEQIKKLNPTDNTLASIINKLEIESCRPYFSLDYKPEKTNAFEKLPEKFFAIAPGASYLAKRCPEEIFIEILIKLSHLDQRLAVVFLGDKNDFNIAERIILGCKKYLDCSFFQNLCGELSLSDTALVLKKSRALLANDSSLNHIAEAVHTPVAAVFGATSEDFGFRTWSDSSQTFSANLGCRPCSKHGKKVCRYNDMKCYHAIDKNQIVAFLETKFSPIKEKDK
ncbi:MAG: glycosyltransferase family 9 protein [Oligoflexales bacterium]|nr:glycosyltransferase family 9 protein [Oligoflexales bacterium]